MFTDDPALVAAFKSRFDRIWNDTTAEPQSIGGGPPYLKNWNEACALESACWDYWVQYPNRAPMVINTARLEPDSPTPPDLIWGQGPEFNNRLVTEINNESSLDPVRDLPADGRQHHAGAVEQMALGRPRSPDRRAERIPEQEVA